MGLPAEKEHIPDRLASPRLPGPGEERAQARFRVREERQDGHGKEPRRHSRRDQRRHGLEPEIGPWGPGLDLPQERGVHRCERDIDDEIAPARDLCEQLDVSRDARRFRGDADPKPRHPGDCLEHPARHLEAGFRGLIRIRDRADRHLLATLESAPEPGRQLDRIGLFHVDTSLELGRIGVAEVPVRRPRIAVTTAELASAKRIDRPAERKARVLQSIHELFSLKRAELHAPPLVYDGTDPFHECRCRFPSLVRHVVTCLVYMSLEKAPRFPPGPSSLSFV